MKKWMSFLICGIVIVMAASFSIPAIGQELENPIPNSIYVEIHNGTGDLSAYKIAKIKVSGLDFLLSSVSFVVECPEDIQILWVRNGNFLGNEIAFFTSIEREKIRIGLMAKKEHGTLGSGILAEIIFSSVKEIDRLAKEFKLAEVRGVDINGNLVEFVSPPQLKTEI